MKQLTVESAKELLNSKMNNVNLVRHCWAVGLVLSELFDYYKKQGRDTGGLTKEQWEIVGILHDCDWELTAKDPSNHTILLMEWLKEYDVTQEMLDVFRSHNTKVTNLKDPQTLLEWTLECVDELTGFIVAVALILPSKKLSEVTVERVIKKFAQKEFARAVHREQITQCAEKINIPVEEFVGTALSVMQKNSDLLGL